LASRWFSGRRKSAGWRSVKDDVHLKMNLRGTRTIVRLAAILLAVARGASGQSPDLQGGQATAQAPVVITLEEAIHRAQSSQANYAAAMAAGQSARLDRNIAYAGLLPSVTYNNTALYTEPQRPYSRSLSTPGTAEPSPIYIANNAPREYVSQGTVSETIGMANVAGAHRAAALAAQAEAEQEIARRGLVSAVVSLFYGLLASDHKLAVADRADEEAVDFTKLTGEREQARESAHADVVRRSSRSNHGGASWAMRGSRPRKRAWNWVCCCFPIRVLPSR
jgi:outer membrane protein TolC